MSDSDWNAPAELIQTAICGKGWGGGRAPTRVMKASIGDIVHHLRRQDMEEIWRFSVVTAAGHHIRSAELRSLVRSGGPSA